MRSLGAGPVLLARPPTPPSREPRGPEGRRGSDRLGEEPKHAQASACSGADWILPVSFLEPLGEKPLDTSSLKEKGTAFSGKLQHKCHGGMASVQEPAVVSLLRAAVGAPVYPPRGNPSQGIRLVRSTGTVGSEGPRHGSAWGRGTCPQSRMSATDFCHLKQAGMSPFPSAVQQVAVTLWAAARAASIDR